MAAPPTARRAVTPPPRAQAAAGRPAPGGKGERTRRRILQHAIARFAAEGRQRTALADIARDAGVTPAAVYAYFPGKEALFRAAVDADAEALLAAARARASGDSVRDVYWTTVAALREALPSHPLVRRVLAGLEPGVGAQLLELPSLVEARRELIDALRAGQATGEIRADIEPEPFATGLEALVLSALMAELQLGAHDEQLVLSVVAVLDAALRPS
ncbi:MAG: hypothetical protein KatS3mg009_1704 [Acidimicrobiia bacterium]|nr:MAG: hypothetical protein KatS3mg009_1704 [Acidimicrobiia bacterium]